MFYFSLSGLPSIQEDLNNEKAKILQQAALALNTVGDSMISDLQRYGKSVWYDTWKPSEYKRRTDDPSLGTPLLDYQNMQYTVKDHTLEFLYTPTGEHNMRLEGGGYGEGGSSAWDTRQGDEIIESIQTGHLWGNPPPRPYWNWFVEAQFNRNIILAFAEGMAKGKPRYVVESEGISADVLYDKNESKLEQKQNTQLNNLRFSI